MVHGSVQHSSPAFAEANGIRLCYDTFGNPADVPVILIMGLAAQMIVWDDTFCSELAARGRYVVRFDNRDIGLSTRFDHIRPPSIADYLLSRLPGRLYRAPYTLRDMAADTVGLMDALRIGTAHVVGISMGGAIAQELAIHFRSRLRTLTAIMATTGNPKLPPPTRKALAVLLGRSPRGRDAFARNYDARWRVLWGDVIPFEAERIHRQGMTTYERGISPDGVRRQLAAIVASGNRSAALRDVSIPALVIHGTADPLVRYPAAFDLCAALGGAELLSLSGMGHTLPKVLWPRIIDAIAARTSTDNGYAAAEPPDRRT